MDRVTYSKNGQAMPAQVLPVGPEAFAKQEGTTITWLGGAGILINSRGTTILVDPLLMGFDMPLLFDIPLTVQDVPALDGYLVTHIDNDHCSHETAEALKTVCKSYHATQYVASEMIKHGVAAQGHDIGDTFSVGDVKVRLTPARHNWQNYMEEFSFREWKEEDYCGFWFDTPDGSIWLPGDSQLLESQLEMPQPDAILFDFSDNIWHITLEGAIRLANTYPNAKLLCIHWGTVDAPAMEPFNGDPNNLLERVVNPERILPVYPGEVWKLA